MATLDFCGILKESSTITNSHSRHFLALSVLFLLPLSFSMIALPTLQHSIADITTPQPVQILLRLHYQQQQPIALKPLFFALLFALTFLTLLLSATATITYSFYNGFFGRPVKLASAIKSLSNSLMRSFATVLCAGILVLGSVVGVGMVALGVIRGIEELGFEVAYSSVYFRVFQWCGVGILGLGLLWLYLNWVLAPVVVVVESSWGFEPLRRSAYLVKEMRGGAVCLVLYFGGMLGVNVWGSWGTSVGSGVFGALWFVAMTVLCSACIMVFLLQSVAANTLLYMKCKAVRGELAGEIVEEFAQEYLCLPFDEPKVPRLVSILQP